VNVLVLDDRNLPDYTGRPVPVKKGQVFDIQNRNVLRKLLQAGIVAEIGAPFKLTAGCRPGTPLPAPSSKKRIGFYTFTSNHYSGGRIHLWQMAWALADMGHEVWFITNARPIWQKDYPDTPNLKLITDTTTPIPPDFDYVITDGKLAAGKGAVQYNTLYPRAKLCVINFETHLWVAKYALETSKRMENTIPVLKAADILLANSEPSCQDVREAIGRPDADVTAVPPVVNTYALGFPDVKLPAEMERNAGTPYVTWVSRASLYKGIQDAVNAVKAYPGPLNLIAMGHPGVINKHDSDLHKFITFGAALSDAQKMKIMAGATCVVAPSKFEGYGMVPGEALCSGTPAVVYDLPVLRENYGDRIVYAKWGDSADFSKKVRETVDNPPAVDVPEAHERYGLQAMKIKLASIPAFTPEKRISAQLICYYGPTVTEALASVYPHVDEILIAYGPTGLWKDMAPDDALDQIRAFPDPDRKIKLEVRAEWQNKTAMRQWCADNATGNRMLIFDADEIYHNLDKWIEADPLAGCPRWVHFWHDEEHYVTDSAGDQRWGRHEDGKIGTRHPHYRWSHWRNSYHFGSTKGVRAQDITGESLTNGNLTLMADAACPECVIYHLGHTLAAERMAQKHDYYLQRDGKGAGRVRRKAAWHQWNGKTGEQGDGIIRKVDWELPPLVKQAFGRNEKTA